VQGDYEALLERQLTADDVEDVKKMLGEAYSKRQSMQSGIVSSLEDDLARRVEESAGIKAELESLRRKVHEGTTVASKSAPGMNGSKTIQQQVADFDVMKKSLMRDLQNRCERVVELEISLDEMREQYNNVLRTSNNKAQQKKMAFLERNLEQLTHVQRQLVEQNSSLKKEVAIAERKLMARNERIASLETLLHDSQEKLNAASHRYVPELGQTDCSVCTRGTPSANTSFCSSHYQVRSTAYRREGKTGSREGELRPRTGIVRLEWCRWVRARRCWYGNRCGLADCKALARWGRRSRRRKRKRRWRRISCANGREPSSTGWSNAAYELVARMRYNTAEDDVTRTTRQAFGRRLFGIVSGVMANRVFCDMTLKDFGLGLLGQNLGAL